MQKNKQPLFEFEMLAPLLCFKGFPLSEIYNHIFDFGAVPFCVINDKNHHVFKKYEEIKPEGAELENVIFCIKPLKILTA